MHIINSIFDVICYPIPYVNLLLFCHTPKEENLSLGYHSWTVSPPQTRGKQGIYEYKSKLGLRRIRWIKIGGAYVDNRSWYGVILSSKFRCLSQSSSIFFNLWIKEFFLTTSIPGHTKERIEASNHSPTMTSIC